MTRRRLLAAVPAVIVLVGACSDTTTTGVTELNLDRPVDVSFACYGQMKLTSGALTTANTAMPTAVCQQLSPQVTPRDATTGAPTPLKPYPGQDGAKPPSWYGFILQSASGTVALTTWPSTPADVMSPPGQLTQQVSDTPTSLFQVLDADPLTPGKNALSIGEDPVAIVTDKTGCFEVTANAGSCDLSELDITSALGNIVDHNTVRPRIDRVQVTAPGGAPVLAKPAAMIAEPFLDVAPGTDTAGNACPATAASKVYIAYPSCHLVAEVQLGADAMTGKATAQVIGGIHFDQNGAAGVLTGQPLADVLSSCPTDCAPPCGMPVVTVTDGVRPVALDYRLDTRTEIFGNTVVKPITSRLAIGADIRGALLAAPLTVVDLDLTTFDPLPATLLSIPLEANGGPVGVSALALSPQIGMGNDTGGGTVNDEANDQAQYVYAVATDGTVRVADVLKVKGQVKGECDTQVDGRFLRNALPSDLECLPLGQPDKPRRPGARSPGIELPDGAVASSVAIVKGLAAPPPIFDASSNKPTGSKVSPSPSTWLGYFAFITASSGVVYMANVEDDYVVHNVNPTSQDHALETSPVLVMAHQLRDSVANREDKPVDSATVCAATDGKDGPAHGGPRLTAPPAQQKAPATLSDDLNSQLPRLQQVECDRASNVALTALELGAAEVGSGSGAGPAPARDTAYPDLKSVVGENWTLTYEGTLEVDTTVNSINGPSLHFGQTFVDRTGMFLADASRPFCTMGAEPGDIVEFQGCNPANLDADCPSGYTCYVHPQSLVGGGACFLKSEAPRLQDACRDFLSSVRRYTVGTDANGGTAPGKLVLWQRKHELSTTPVDGCVSDDQCDDLARAALVINQSADPFVEAAPGTPPDKRPTHWSCMADPLRKAINADPDRNKRCVQVCDPTPPDPENPAPAPVCTRGTVCVANDPKDLRKGGVCMEGIEPPQACLNGPQRYIVRAGEAFTVVGDHSGFVHPIVATPDGSRCVRDPDLAKDPLSIGRIPLTAPPCGPAPTDPMGVLNYPFTGRIDSSTFEANPCSLTVPQFELELKYPDPVTPGAYGSCRGPTVVQPSPTMPAVPTSHPAPAIKFRNRALTLTIVDPYREAAQSCLLRDPIDTQTSANIPMVVPGYQITFAVKAGFAPITMPLVNQVSPVKVVRGPSESIWVIDDGDFLATTFVDVSTRGRVFRIESVPAPAIDDSSTIVVNTMQ